MVERAAPASWEDFAEGEDGREDGDGAAPAWDDAAWDDDGDGAAPAAAKAPTARSPPKPPPALRCVTDMVAKRSGKLEMALRMRRLLVVVDPVDSYAPRRL